VFSASPINKYMVDYNEHLHACRCDKKVNNGFKALSRAYFIYSLHSTHCFTSTLNLSI